MTKKEKKKEKNRRVEGIAWNIKRYVTETLLVTAVRRDTCARMFRNAALGAHNETHVVNRRQGEAYLHKYREKV